MIFTPGIHPAESDVHSESQREIVKALALESGGLRTNFQLEHGLERVGSPLMSPVGKGRIASG